MMNEKFNEEVRRKFGGNPYKKEETSSENGFKVLTKKEYLETTFHKTMIIGIFISFIGLLTGIFLLGIFLGSILWIIDGWVRINATQSQGTHLHCDRPNYPFK